MIRHTVIELRIRCVVLKGYSDAAQRRRRRPSTRVRTRLGESSSFPPRFASARPRLVLPSGHRSKLGPAFRKKAAIIETFSVPLPFPYEPSGRLK